MAKESLFNILTNKIDFTSVSVLDLFAGTGSISFEFLSRGTSNITMVELNFKHVQFIKSVVKELGEAATIYRADVFKFLRHEKTRYDLIFADPPYDHPHFGEIPGKILEKNLLTDNGLLIVEHSKKFDFSKIPGFVELRKYGNVNFSFFTQNKRGPNRR